MPRPPRAETLDETRARFLAKVEPQPDGCWRWTAHIRSGSGYGGFRFCGAAWRAHRAAFVLFRGEIPAGLLVRHLCHDKACVNPAHLALGTPADNGRDCVLAGRRRRVTCRKGHLLTADNVVLDATRGGRKCRTCARKKGREAMRRARARKKAGAPAAEPRDVRERFLSYVRVAGPDACWMWAGYVAHHGYGSFTWGNQSVRAHRASYRLHVGEIPAGQVVRHRCHVKTCVNPAHLLLGTPAENSRDYREAGYGRKERCKSGRHELTGYNLYVDPDGGRHCRGCEDLRLHTNEGRRAQRASRWKRLGKADAEQRADVRHYRERRAVCKRGHALAGANVYVDGRGERSCKACQRRRQQTPEAKFLKKVLCLVRRYGIDRAEAERRARNGFDARRHEPPVGNVRRRKPADPGQLALSL